MKRKIKKTFYGFPMDLNGHECLVKTWKLSIMCLKTNKSMPCEVFFKYTST